MNQPNVAVVLVEFRNQELTNRCINSLLSGTYKKFTIFLVDNTPRSKSSSQFEEKRFKDFGNQLKAKLFTMETNIGFCAGCNIGIKEALKEDYDYVLILNYDTIVAPNFLNNLVSSAEKIDNLGILAGKIFYEEPKNKIWYAGGNLSRLLGVGRHVGFNTMDTGKYNTFKQITYATGCCMLMPTHVLRTVGNFNHKLFMYLDDAEFCIRVIKNGLKIFYEPRAVLWHRVGPGQNKKNYSDYYIYFSIRNKPWITNDLLYKTYLFLFTFLLAFVKLLFYGLSPGVELRRSKIKAVYTGLIDSFTLNESIAKRFPKLFEIK